MKKLSKKTVKFLVNLPEELDKKLERKSRKIRKTKAFITREALNEHLNNK